MPNSNDNISISDVRAEAATALARLNDPHSAPQGEQARIIEIDPATPSPAPESTLEQVWRAAILRLLATYQGMDGRQRKAFRRGIEYSVASLRLGAADMAARGSGGMADYIKHVAQSLENSTAQLEAMGKNGPIKS